MDKSLLHSLFYHVLYYLVMLTNFKNLSQRSSTIVANSWVMHLNMSQSVMLVISIEPILFLYFLINSFSLLLFLMIDCFFFWMNSSSMVMLEAWFKGLQRSSEIRWCWISLILLGETLSSILNLNSESCLHIK